MIDLTEHDDSTLTTAQRELLLVIETEDDIPKRDAHWDQLFEITDELARRRQPEEAA